MYKVDLSAAKASAAGIPFPSQEKQDLARALGCCILRARTISGDSTVPENEVYWHTREACYPVSRRLGLLWSWVMLKEKAAHSLSSDEIVRFSDPFWLEVVHPDVIAREVMES